MTLTQQLAIELGATSERLDQIRRTPYPQAAQSLEELKGEVRGAYKKLAFKYHPDRNPEDLEGSAERFKALSQAMREIESIQVAPRKRASEVRSGVTVPIHQRAFIPGYNTTSSSSTQYGQVVSAINRGTSTSTSYDARRVMFIKIW